MGRFDNMSVFHAAVTVYGEDGADEFMNHFHRGSVAKAVLGDENAFVNPANLDDQQTEKMLSYLASLTEPSAGPA